MKSLIGKIIFTSIVFLLAKQTVCADSVGPANVAVADMALWSESIATPAGFDKASRAANIIYLQQLHAMRTLSDDDILRAFNLKSVNRAGVDKWLSHEVIATASNYKIAEQSCGDSDFTCVKSGDGLSALESGKVAFPKEFQAWSEGVTAFTKIYIGEQLRLAALFPKVTSEIDTFSSQEWTGSSVSDRQFFLTFDDGPTPPNGSSDDTVRTLTTEKKTGTFFVLGENFQKRLAATSGDAMKTLYANHCIASHGWTHQSHAKLPSWQDSVIRTQEIITDSIEQRNVLPLFRPPYGQRKDNSGDFFKEQQIKVGLWNIDSQDWNAKIDVKSLENRVLILMLLKRHGVILFHDVHPKAKNALPRIFEAVDGAVSWSDCHELQALQEN
ncbi:MAG: polysaccharide deacetylase family protein [Spongiibacteraceae bacterium]